MLDNLGYTWDNINILTDTERSTMNDTENQPETAHQPAAAEVIATTAPPPPKAAVKRKHTAKAPAQSQELSTHKQAEDLAKVIDSFLIGTKTAEKLKPTQIALCKQTALAFGLNPLKREIHFIPREIRKKGPQGWYGTGEYEATIVIGYEVYIKRAEATGKLNGWGVTFEKDGTDQKAILTVYKKGWEHPFLHETYLSEARQQTPIWDKMPRFMLRKTVIGQGFRLAFPEEMGGLPYLPEEIGVGVIENGTLIEEQKGLPAAAPEKPTLPPPPAPITAQQCTLILGLLTRKGKDQQVILDFFKVEKLSHLTERQGAAIITKLGAAPDAADKAPQEDLSQLDLDQIDQGIQQQQLNREPDPRPVAKAEQEAE